MANLREIRNRIASIKSTGKITRAMEMVAAAKLRKAQAAMDNARPYSEMLSKMLKYLLTGVEREEYPLLAIRPVKMVEMIVVAGDKGLCGAFNSNVFKEVAKQISFLKNNGSGYRLSVVGRRTRDILKRQGHELRYSLVDVSRSMQYSQVQDMAKDIIDDYVSGLIDEVLIISNRFVSISTQAVKSVKLLPIEASVENMVTESGQGSASSFIFEPSEGVILNKLLPKYVENGIYLSMLESRASEEAARMMAMQNATSNTKELTSDLTLQYNKARQASITIELIDIVSGAAAITS
ncbi:MAG: ATP synthase F1 subunit gamma [Candidatus Magnetoovum sp. WYHC-5]|nr:ATP synthase F1 subunit gamma [Candidatus Magnetoovum sp. WYHC-5]